jgi:hypothetical protein
MVAGGNLAASIAYGDITAAAVGTATAVCGDEVLGFGHPMLWTGPATLTLHSADALFVQEDPTFAGFKVANIGDPVGSVSQDRMAGILGVRGATPPTTDITSDVASGTRQRLDGTTHVTVPAWVPDMALSHLLANEDRVFDGIGKGSGAVGWTIDGTREDGSPFTLQRDDIYADASDLTFATAWDLYVAASTLQFNGVEDITIDAVDANATLSRDFDRYVIKRVEVRKAGVWVPLDESRLVKLRAGKTKLFRVQLNSPKSGLHPLIMEVPVPRHTVGMFGTLDIFGGNSGAFDEGGFFEGDPSLGSEEPQTFDELLASLDNAPRNDDVIADLSFYDDQGAVAKKRERRTATGLVVDGAVSVGVRVR